MKKLLATICGSLILVSGVQLAPAQAASSLKLLWSDEFNGAAGSDPNSKFYTFESGSGQNNEMQWYTQDSVKTNGTGSLDITATKIPVLSPDQLPYNCFGDCQYFSGRINTQGKLSFKYGRLEARIKMPSGTGAWPAFWLLGNNITAKSWPTCGEIDIVELRGRQPNVAIATAHGPGYSGVQGKSNVFKSATSLADGYHTYALDWAPNRLSWYLDGKLYQTLTPASVRPKAWVFNQSFFMILNLAMGGDFDGGQLDTSIDSTKMSIDYIRYYSVNGVGSVSYH